MSIHQKWISRTTQLTTACLLSLCILGCNSNDAEDHHVTLTGFGTGADSDTLFKRDGAEPAPVEKVVPVQPAQIKPKPVAAKPKQQLAKAAPSPVEKAVKKPEVKPTVPAKPAPAVKSSPKKEAPKKAAPKKVVETKKPAEEKKVALATPKPAPAKKEDKAEGGQPKLPAGTGGFAGTITFDGPAPAQTDLYAKGEAPKDPSVCGLQAVPDESLLVNPKNKGVANVFIYLQKSPKGWKDTAAEIESIDFDQKYCVFLPHNLIVRAGQEVLVKNSDPITHNTHTNPFRNSGFNSAIAANEQKGVPLTYRSPERLPVKVVCDLHAWMKAYHLVLDHPFAATTDEDGNFAIPGLKPGNYTFIIWHEKPGYLEKRYKVTVKAGSYTEKPLKFKPAKFAANDGLKLKTVTIAGAH